MLLDSLSRTVGLVVLVIFSLVATISAANSTSGGVAFCACTGCTVNQCATPGAIASCNTLDGSVTGCASGSTTINCGDTSCGDGTEGTLTFVEQCSAVCTTTLGCTGFTYSCTGPVNYNYCFHEETQINYRGKMYSLADLQNGAEPECRVPHTPFSRGLVVTANCLSPSFPTEKTKILRVTDTHLVATTKGFQIASSLQVGDTLSADFEDVEYCLVSSVAKEREAQRYFGLNCLFSEVLADGIRTSTFGDFHTLPAWYLYYSGSVWGVPTASRIGEHIAEWFYDTTSASIATDGR